MQSNTRNIGYTLAFLSTPMLYGMEHGQSLHYKNPEQQRECTQSERSQQRIPSRQNAQEPISGDMPFLIQFICRGDTEAVKQILNKGAIAIDTEMAPGRTLLYFAVMSRQISSIATLLEYGANVELMYKNEDVQERLAMPEYEEVKLALEGKVKRSQKVSLEEAIANTNLQVVARLLDSPPLIVETYYPFAVKRVTKEELASFDVLVLAIERIASMQPSRERDRAFSIVKLLVEANPAAVQAHEGGRGLQLLHSAARINALDVIAFLIDKGADKNALDENGATPLYRALTAGSLEAVNTLLMYGANRDLYPTGTTLQGEPFMTSGQLLDFWISSDLERERVQRECPLVYEWYQNERRQREMLDGWQQELEDIFGKAKKELDQRASSARYAKRRQQWLQRACLVGVGFLAGYIVYNYFNPRKAASGHGHLESD